MISTFKNDLIPPMSVYLPSPSHLSAVFNRRVSLSFLPVRLAVSGLALAVFSALPADAQRVFPQDHSERAVESMKENVAFLLTLTDEELRERVPVESSGIWFTDCPNCDFGSQDRGRFDWQPEEPTRIQCEGCGEIYPDNPKYPDYNYLEVDAPGDGTHRFSYWENEDGYRIFFRAHADYLHMRYLEARIRELGRLYAVTGEDQYARPVATLLHRMAEVVTGYAYIYDFPYRDKLFSPYTDNRLPVARYRTSLWTRWAYNDIPRPLLEAYDALRDWDGWERVARGDPRPKIEKDLFTFIVEFVLGFEDPLTNMSPRVWQDATYAGRILNRPEWVHESIQRFERMLDQRFMHDGHWFETSPSYHAMTIVGMRRIMNAAQGYSDPEDYVHPETGRRFDDLDLSRDVPHYVLAIRALEETRLPSGRLLPLNDTWAVRDRVERERREPRETSESLLMPGLGVAILGGGAGDDQVFSWLNFTSGTAHKQRDTLSIGLYAHGEEVLSDIGYTHTRYNTSWASSMMSHNTVVVDGSESEFDPDHSGNRLVAFASNEKDFHLAAAESVAAYPEQTDRYRRTLFLLGEDSRDAYLLDIFEIQGGDQHDYLLHGNADKDSTARLAGTELASFEGSLVNPGAEFEEPTGEHDDMGPSGSFSFIRDLQRGSGGNPLTLDLRLEADPAIGSRSILAAMPETEVFLGRSPSIRRAEESDARINDYFMPGFVLRRRGENLDSIFVAAHEVIHGEPKLEAIDTWREDNRIWISITHEDGRDYVSVALQDSAEGSMETDSGEFFTDGVYAAVRLDADGNIRSTHLAEGARLRFGDHELRGPGAFSGKVRGIEGGRPGDSAFDLDRVLEVANPDSLVVEFPDGSSRGFTVTEIENRSNGTRVHVREAAGFEIGSGEIELTSFPQRTIEGTTLRYRLIDSAHGR